ncbi:ATP-dependent DNA helicase RecG [Calidifontibacillus erzurumensis]|uniref:ATP-dependent DNA helicase RecG n=1 Tax=Calidifontibacillus erzurumensis TaxID=2741433 RepID=A0A8J8GDM0_9BACI|nr:ATP-dependent DNA helicase RecG [Calidifontibacillus erzurumensis]NSL51221.1 ATP-dependent DNA helicase RecG [Calidifontibacillus erzurumensis]
MNRLNQSIINVKGVGEETALQLNEMGIHTIGELIEYFPYRYEDYRIRDLHTIKHNEKITVEGKVHSEPSLTFYGRNKSRLMVRVFINNLLITVVFFNQPYLKKQIGVGDIITITGKWDSHRQTITGSLLKKGIVTGRQELEPVYSVRGKMTTKLMQRIIRSALNEYGNEILEFLPVSILKKYKLLPRKDAVQYIHQPESAEYLKQARRRLVYEEFLLFQLKMQSLRKFERERSGGFSQKFSMRKIEQFIATLPFPLTNAQQRVVTEILHDMSSPYRMNRLLQGDVGSGKTVVAAIALYAAICAGYQGALMVPTEILAEQHATSLINIFEQHDISIALLTSSVKGKKRKDILERLQKGEIDLLIGTHALIQDEVNFHKLGLVITDEQHRFGVEQRRILREKGENPDVLFMTATPIPRTLAITVFGDMDVSVIDEMPAGRKKIETYWVKEQMFERVLQFIYKEVKKGRQAYVICPLIEESEKLDVQNAIDVHAMLVHYFPENIKIGLMHGRLHSSEKEEVMRKFSENEYHILVSTTVVEVGVNVPNATVMVVIDAERFGLAQLHQLRGRVGRGSEQSYCILIADPKSEIGIERMKIMTETNDGFELSQKDLELRGPGDFFGKKQSGLPEFKLADMVHDYKILEVARNDAIKLISSKIFWESDDFSLLRSYLEETGVLNGEKLD